MSSPTQTVHIELERGEIKALLDNGRAPKLRTERDSGRKKLRAALSSSPEQGGEAWGCPFCDYRGPSEVLHDWDDAYAIEPIRPVVPGHVLVIPKAHVVNFTCSPPTTAMVMQRAAEYAAVKAGDFNLITSQGAVATQTVEHLHVHLVPRCDGDGLLLPWSLAPALSDEEKERLERIAGDLEEECGCKVVGKCETCSQVSLLRTLASQEQGETEHCDGSGRIYPAGAAPDYPCPGCPRCQPPEHLEHDTHESRMEVHELEAEADEPEGEVEAVQWTGENLEEFRAFTNLSAPILLGAMVGDWIVEDIDGAHLILSPAIFEATYEPAPLEGDRG